MLYMPRTTFAMKFKFVENHHLTLTTHIWYFVYSLTDPRAIPAEASEFAQKIKEGSKASSLDETLQLIDKHYDYFAVPFSNGELLNEPNVNTGSAKIFRYYGTSNIAANSSS